MESFGDEEIYWGRPQRGAFCFVDMQDVFERSFFTTADKELKLLALKNYARLPHTEMHHDRIGQAIDALESRSLSWLSFPQKAAMKNQRDTLRVFIADVRDILPPISHAADRFAPNFDFLLNEDTTLAAIFFKSLKIRLGGHLQEARQIFRHGAIIIGDKNHTAEKVGAFGTIIRDDISMHLLGIQAMTTYNDGFLQDTRRLAEHVIETDEVNIFIKRLSALMSAVDGFAKARTGDHNQDQIYRQKMLEGIVRIVPVIISVIRRIGDKVQEHRDTLPSDLIKTAELLPIIGYNLDQIREDRPRRPPQSNPDHPHM